MSRKIVTVSVLVDYLKSYLNKDPVLHQFLVEGEVSNIRKPSSGHWYFSLKDDKASVSCVMFSATNKRLDFAVNDGDKIIIRGDIGVYPAQGQLQIIVSDMQPSGIGLLYLKLEALKKKLFAEGLFDEAHKKKIPAYPMRIGLVTGNNTAAREDVLITLKRRWPVASLSEFNCPVQGETAAPEIIKALCKADEAGLDIILLVRGGGSLEDLWCFNDEELARCIYHLNTPVITGIGHEINTSVADYVSDLSANTPTGAVEKSVPDIRQVIHTLQNFRKRLTVAMITRRRFEQNRLVNYRSRPVFTKPERLYGQQAIHLNYLSEKINDSLRIRIDYERHKLLEEKSVFQSIARRRINNTYITLRNDKTGIILYVDRFIKEQMNLLSNMKKNMVNALGSCVEEHKDRIKSCKDLLRAYSPLFILQRGYNIAYKDGKIIKSIREVNLSDKIALSFYDGSAEAVITGKEKADDGKKDDI